MANMIKKSKKREWKGGDFSREYKFLLKIM